MEGIKSKLLLTTMHGTQEIETKAVDDLMASNFENIAASLALPRTYVSQQIPASRNLSTGNGARMASPAAG